MIMHYRTLKLTFVCIQHYVRCLTNKTVQHIKLALRISCSTVKDNALLMRNISVEIGKVCHSDEFCFIAFFKLDMIIYK